jgi:hypothetical protein
VSAPSESATSLLRGIIVRQESDTLVVRASPEEVATFAAPAGISMSALRPSGMGVTPMPGDVLYNASGQPVAVVTDLEFHTERVDVTTFGDEQRVYLPGRRSARIGANVIITT